MTIIEELIQEVKRAEFFAENHLSGLEPDFDVFLTSAVYNKIIDHYMTIGPRTSILGHKLFVQESNEMCYWFANKKKLCSNDE